MSTDEKIQEINRLLKQSWRDLEEANDVLDELEELKYLRKQEILKNLTIH